MSKKTKIAELLGVALGAIIAFGAVMGASRPFSGGEPVDSSNAGSNVETESSSGLNSSNGANSSGGANGGNVEAGERLGISPLQEGVNVEGYELMLAYDNADDFLDACRLAMENSDTNVFEPGYTYLCDILYEHGDDSGRCKSMFVCYDYSQNVEDDVLVLQWGGESIMTVKRTGIFGGTHCMSSEKPLFYSERYSSKAILGTRDWSNEGDIITDSINDGVDCMPEAIIYLVRLVAPAS